MSILAGNYVTERAVVRFLRLKGYDVEICSSCSSEFDGGYSSPFEIDLGKGRWSEVTCSVFGAWQDYERDGPKYISRGHHAPAAGFEMWEPV